MPVTGAAGRAEQMATLSGLLHANQTDPALADLLDAAGELELEGDNAALVRVARRDVEKARRVPPELVRALAHAASAGHVAWARAREADDFAAFQPTLEHNVELRTEYAACFDVAEPYDALLDDPAPGVAPEEVRAAFAPLRAELRGLVAEGAEHAPPPLRGPFPIHGQRPPLAMGLPRVRVGPAAVG